MDSLEDLSKKASIEAFESMKAFSFEREWHVNNILNKKYDANIDFLDINLNWLEAYANIVETFGFEVLSDKHNVDFVKNVINVCQQASQIFGEFDVFNDEIQKSRNYMVDVFARIYDLHKKETI